MTELEFPDFGLAGAGILFADDFDEEEAEEPAIPAAPPAPWPTFTQAQLDAACLEAREAGRGERIDEGAAQMNLSATRVFDEIGSMLDTVSKEEATRQQHAIDAICRLILDTLVAMFPSLRLRRDPAEIADIVRTLIVGMAQETVICVTVAPSISDLVGEALMRLRPELARRVVIAAEDGIEPGDVRMTWQGGAASRSSRETQEAVVDILSRFGLLEPSKPPQKATPPWQPTTRAMPMPAQSLDNRENINA